ncbi:low molecular weight protein tyrosine phosphatase family protein [Paenibacillus odorifer]|uniref:low molecular weight protein tyrosine phosphatase family protein n=1 Tax=Paenibacillus TaxID=44249 RepID=UPI00096DE823|nr:protein tyrosine phosphatase [Paenibacillus odorifer]
MKLLFVCSQNRWRSLTAEKIFQGIDGHEARSAGTEDHARIKISEGHLGWADVVFVMEKKHVRRIQDKFRDCVRGKKIICLNIADDYKYMDEDLIGLLESSVSEYLLEWSNKNEN